MSNFTNTLLTYVPDKSQQLEILHFIFCVKNNLSYGKLLVIKGSAVDKSLSKYAVREMNYDNLLNEIKKQCGSKYCGLTELNLVDGKTQFNFSGIAYFKYHKEGENLINYERYATVNNIILITEHDISVNKTKHSFVTINKISFNLSYSSEDIQMLQVDKVNFCNFLTNYSTDSHHKIETIDENNQNNNFDITRIQLEFEEMLTNSLCENTKLQAELDKIKETKEKLQLEVNQLVEMKETITKLQTELDKMKETEIRLQSELKTSNANYNSLTEEKILTESQFKFVLEEKLKLEIEYENLSLTKANLDSQLIELLMLKSKLETELNILKTVQSQTEQTKSLTPKILVKKPTNPVSNKSQDLKPTLQSKTSFLPSDGSKLTKKSSNTTSNLTSNAKQKTSTLSSSVKPRPKQTCTF